MDWCRGKPRAAVILAACATCAVLAACPSGAANAAASTAGPPPLTVLTPGANNCNGDIFLAPIGGNYASGPEIVTNTGEVVWFHALPTGTAALDFRTQTYQGQPVLTWYQNDGVGGSFGVIYNSHFNQVATVHAGNGYVMDVHEFLITPWNTALILAVGSSTVNLTSIGGPADQLVFDNLVQEIDIRTGKVLFQWNAADHVPYSDSHEPLPPTASQPWDWFHINAVRFDSDGNLLVSSRHTWTVYKVNRRTGQVIWELGGRQSSFTLKAAPGQVLDNAGEIFAWQHYPVGLGNGLYRVFDNESDGVQPELSYSRVDVIKLDVKTHTATLVKSINQPEGLVGFALGDAQTTWNADVFVSWGTQPFISEFSPSGKLLFNAELPAGVFTYRAYRIPWPPRPRLAGRVSCPATPCPTRSGPDIGDRCLATGRRTI
jgi:outer membrane protein assembly factor BamB